MSRKLKVMTEIEAADELRISVSALRAMLEAKTLRGFKIGEEWRTTETNIVRFIEQQSGEGIAGSDANETYENETLGVDKLSELQEGWIEVAGLKHFWPTEREPETYDRAYKRTVSLNGKTVPLMIGFGNRPAAGMDRRRAVVFWGDREDSKYPLVEFTGANDFDETKLMASVIKVGRKQLRSTDEVPAAYAGFTTEIYRDVVTGPYASQNVSIVVREDELGKMALHGLIRLSQKGWAN